VSARHDALRTAFRWEGVAEPRQEVVAEAFVPVIVLDWSTDAPAVVDGKWRALMAADRVRGFDLREAPLQRVTLVRLSIARGK